MIRKIYMIEAIDVDGTCWGRRYARTYEAAQWIQTWYGGAEHASIQLLEDWEHVFIDPDWVEG